MNATTTLAATVTAALLLGACAGRAPNPVAVSQAQDSSTSCAAMQAEMTANNEKIEQLGTDKGWKVAQNVGAGVAGLVIWPLWFAMDFQGAASTDQEALEQRNDHLGQLVLERCANAPDVATVD